MNRVILMGRLTANPECKQTQKGTTSNLFLMVQFHFNIKFNPTSLFLEGLDIC